MNRRDLVIGASALAGLSACAGRGAGEAASRRHGAGARVAAARLEPAPEGEFFIPRGDMLTQNSAAFGYVNEEWFARGEDNYGQPYLTQLFLRRPADPARFSGTVLVESLHASGVGSVHQVCSPYILRSGHAYVCFASQKLTVERYLTPFPGGRYAALRIGDPPPAPAPAPDDPMARMMVGADISTALLAQCGAAIKARSGPFANLNVAHVILMGHSQTGMVTTHYINTAHEEMRLAGGAPIYDGYFPAGAPVMRFGPRDAPLIQVLSDGDISDGAGSFPPPGRPYRREDSDDLNDRYRLYELAGFPHTATRNPPLNSIEFWRQNNRTFPPGTILNSLPHNEMFGWGLDQLVRWATNGTAPPRAARIEVEPDGRFFAKDEHGNTRGGVRVVQMDVPRATYYSRLPSSVGSGRLEVNGAEVPFDAAKMRRLYGSKAGYVRRFEERLEELIREGWFLREDAESMRREAEAQDF